MPELQKLNPNGFKDASDLTENEFIIKLVCFFRFTLVAISVIRHSYNCHLQVTELSTKVTMDLTKPEKRRKTFEQERKLLIIYDDRIYDEPPHSPISEALKFRQISGMTFTFLQFSQFNNSADLKEHENNTVLLRVPEEKLTDWVLKLVFSTTKHGGKVVAACIEKSVDDVVFNLKLAGFVNVEVKTTSSGTNVFGFKPTYEIGICTGLRKRKHRDLINLANQEFDQVSDPDDLLDEKDFKKPESAALRRCLTLTLCSG